jgi:UPF0755 protein
VAQREREWVADDPNLLLFGPDDEDDGSGYEPQSRLSRRRERRQGRKHRRNGRLMILIALVIVVVAAVVLVPWIKSQFQVKDFSGTGHGSASVVVKPNASATDIGKTLKKDGVVASVQAFVNAATDNSNSANIQPGTYTIKKHMSAKNAVLALLNAKNRSSEQEFVIPEGDTVSDVQAALVKALGADKQAAIAKALKNLKDLPLPTNYRTATGKPTSLEGFLFPATYPVTPGESPTAALSQMIGRFIQQDRDSAFTEGANKLKLSPYQALIAASLVQSEAKFPADMAKVARVIINRLTAGKPLQIDASSLYGVELAGKDPSKVSFAKFPSPYNTYLHTGLPPTPISNPGAVAMHAAVHPTKGDWLFYVNRDKAGDLFFTNNERAFERAVARCRANNWGCGG